MKLIGCAAALLATVPILAQTATPPQEPSLGPAPPISFEDWRPLRTTPDGSEFEVRFPSAFVSGTPENDTVPLRIFVPPSAGRPAPVVVVLHYWGATDLSLEAQQARELNRLGVAAVLVTLPYHIERSPEGVQSGELALRPDVGALVSTMTQSVLDVRRAIDWVETRPEFDAGRVGLVGTSLGAIVGALVHAVEPRIRSSAFMLGGADLARILWTSSVVVRQRDSLRRQGFTEASLREALRGIEPTAYLDAEDTRPTLLVSARFDTVIQPSSAEALVRALPKTQRTTIETGHYGGALVRGRLSRLAAEFLEASLDGREFQAPREVSAPTVRLTVTYNGDTGLQLGAGIDVWRSRPRGETFASAFLTAQGLQGYVGQKIGGGFSVGAIIHRKRTTLGVAWTVVL